jgi:hypothetical protein
MIIKTTVLVGTNSHIDVIAAVVVIASCFGGR